MSKTMIMDHPLVQHKVSLLRNKNTGTKEFKELVCELATLLCYEATRDLPTEEVEIETPIAVAKTRMLSGRKLALVPILRAGLGMVVSAFRYPPCYAVMLLVIALYLFFNVNCVYLVVIGAVCGLLIAEFYERKGDKKHDGAA